MLFVLLLCVWNISWAAGNCSFSSEVVTDDLENAPGTTDILVHRFSCTNSGGDDGTYPRLYSIDYNFTGTASDAAYSITKLYYDLDGSWDGNETLYGTSPVANQMAVFPSNMDIFIPGGQTLYVYLVVDLSHEVTDNATIIPEIKPLKVLAQQTAGNWRITLDTLTSTGDIDIEVDATSLDISGEPQNATQGEAISNNITVKAVDDHQNVDQDYTGTVWFSSSDSDAQLTYDNVPSGDKYTFQSADQGVHTFAGGGFIFNTTGTQNISVTDGAGGLNDDSTEYVSVLTGRYHFVLTGIGASLPTEVTAGTYFDQLGTGLTGIQAEIKDNMEVLYEDYNGTISSYSTEAHSDNSYPQNYQYVPATDNGSYVFSASKFRLCKAGQQKLIIKDVSHDFDGSLEITVLPATYEKLVLSAPESVNAQTEFDVTLRASDAYGNQINDANHKVSLTSDNPDFSAPSTIRFDEGEATAKVTMGGLGTYTLTVIDTQDGSIRGSANITVKMKMDKNMSLGLTNNYITPDTAKRYVNIFVNKASQGKTKVTINVFDTLGRVVKRFSPQPCQKGVNLLEPWDLTGENGSPVAPGTYIISIDGSGIPTSRRMAVIVR